MTATEPLPYVSNDEPERLAALRALHILDTPPEERFDRITRLATELLHVPIAYVSFLDENRQWLKSSCGWDVCETPRRASLCDATLTGRDTLVIPDALADVGYRDHPMVTGAPHVRFYAGRPLVGPGGHYVGTFCIADHHPRRLTNAEERLFELLAEMAEHELGLLEVIELQLGAIAAKAEAAYAHRERAEALNALVESRQRLSDEVAKAARYVASLLPAPIPPGAGPISTDWVFVPSEELGGDAFGYHWIDGDHFALYLLDVSGHGVGVALHSISILNVLRTQSLRRTDFRDPSSVLAALNEAFQMKQYGGMYLTIWYGVYDRRTRRLTYASGGHPPALLAAGGADGIPRVERLRTPGLLVGGIPGVVYPSATRVMPKGSVFYLFSDGVYEVPRADGSMMDLDDFVALVEDHVAKGEYRLAPIVHRLDRIRCCETCLDDVALLRVVFD